MNIILKLILIKVYYLDYKNMNINKIHSYKQYNIKYA